MNVGNDSDIASPNRKVLPEKAKLFHAAKTDVKNVNSANSVPEDSTLHVRQTNIANTDSDFDPNTIGFYQITISNKNFVRAMRMGTEEKIDKSNLDNFLSAHENDLGGILFSLFLTNGGRNEQISTNRLDAKPISNDKIRNLRSILAERIASEIKIFLTETRSQSENLWEIVQTFFTNGMCIENAQQLEEAAGELCGMYGIDEALRPAIELMIILIKTIRNEQIPPESFKYISDILGVSVIIAYAEKMNRHPECYEVYSPGQSIPTRFKASKKNGAIEYNKNDKKQRTILEGAINGGMFLAIHDGLYFDMGNAVENNLIPIPVNWQT